MTVNSLNVPATSTERPLPQREWPRPRWRRGLILHALLLAVSATLVGCGPLQEDIEAREAQRATARKAALEAEKRAEEERERQQRLEQERLAELARQEQEAREQAAQAERDRLRCITSARIQELWSGLQLYYVSFSQFPPHQGQLKSPPDKGPPILEGEVLDVWDQALRIAVGDGKLEIRSLGADGKSESADDIAFSVRVSTEKCGDFIFDVDSELGALECDDPQATAARESARETAARIDEALETLSFGSFEDFIKNQEGVLCGKLLMSRRRGLFMGVRTDDHRKYVERLEKWKKDLQIGEWEAACDDFSAMQESYCYGKYSAYTRGQCLETQKKAMKARTLFATRATSKVTYDAKRKRFTVEVYGILRVTDGSISLEDCWRETCRAQIVSTRPFRVSGGQAKYPKWLRRYSKALERQLKPLKTFRVREKDLEYPRSFEHTLKVDVLVEVVDQQSSIVGDWFSFESLQTRVVGIRAYTDGLTWWKMFKRPRLKAGSTECPNPEYFRVGAKSQTD